MKQQKITKINWAILLVTFLSECILVIPVLGLINNSVYNNVFKLTEILLIYCASDIVYILYLFNLSVSKKERKNILKRYKSDVNYIIIKRFIIIEIIKCTLILSLESELQYFSSIIGIICYTIIICIIFYGLYLIMPKTDNLKLKINKMKKGVKSGNTSLNFILINGDRVPSSFNFKKMVNYKINKNNMYINLNQDFLKIIQKNKKMKKFILDNTVALIHELENTDFDDILRIYNDVEINNSHMYHVMAISNYKETKIPEKIVAINSIKLCDINDTIEYVENLLDIRLEQRISKITYIKTLRKAEKLERKVKDSVQKDRILPRYLKRLDTIYKYNFNNRLKCNDVEVPNEKFAFELYRNAILNQSVYQSVLGMFNYITYINKLIEYYLFSKYNPRYSSTEIYNIIIGDNPIVWNKQILFNIYAHKDCVLYENIREKEFELNNDEKILLRYYLADFLNIEIIEECITYDGLMKLFIKFKNKVEYYKNINDDNVYFIWNITMFFVKMLNEIYKVSQLQCLFDVYSKEVMIGYGEEEKVGLGKYAVIDENFVCLINQEDRYENYIL